MQRDLKNILGLNVRFYEHLCEANESVRKICKKLKDKKYIHEHYSRNGYVKIIIKEGDPPFKIKHIDFLREKFEDIVDIDEL